MYQPPQQQPMQSMQPIPNNVAQQQQPLQPPPPQTKVLPQHYMPVNSQQPQPTTIQAQQPQPQAQPQQQFQQMPQQPPQQQQIPQQPPQTVQPTQNTTPQSQTPQQQSTQQQQAQQYQEAVDSLLKQLDPNLSADQAKNILEQCKQKIISYGNTTIAFNLKNKLFSYCASFQSTVITYTRQQAILSKEGVNPPTQQSTTNNSNIKVTKEFFREKLNLWKSIIEFFKENLKFFNKWREIVYVSIQNINQTHLTPLEIQNEFFTESFSFLKTIFAYIGIEFPPYQILREVKLSNTHQSLEFQSFIEPYYSRATRLSTLLSLSSLSSTSRIVGSSISTNQDNMIPYTNQLTESPPFFTSNKPLNNKYSIIVQHLLSQSVTIEPVKDLLFPQVQSNTLKSKIISIITESLILKTLQLLNKYPNQLIDNQITKDSWKEWILFSDQFYSLVEAQLVDLEQYIVGLSEKRMKNGDTIKDNMVLFLMAKITIISEVKQLFINDLLTPNANDFGHLIPIVISFCSNNNNNNNSNNNDANASNSQNLSLYYFLMRISANLDRLDIQNYIKRVLENYQFQSIFQTYKTWWEIEKNKPKQEFFTTIEDITLYCIFCNILPSESENEIIKFYYLNTEQPYYFPGGIKVCGKIKPVSNLILLNMSLRFRKKLITESIMTLLEKEVPIPPAFLEDYNRLVHYTAGNALPSLLVYLKRIEKTMPFHIVLEVISHRLFKVLKGNKELPIVLKTLQDVQSQKPIQNLQLSKSLDYLVLKISNSIGVDILNAKDFLKTLNLGALLNRRVLFSISKLIKIKGISEFNKIQDVPIFIENSYKNYPYMFSKTTLEYFPDFMKAEFEKINHQPSKPPTLQKVQHENQQKLPIFSQGSKLLVQQRQNIIQHYLQENNANLFFCQIFIYVLESKIKNEILLPLVQQLVIIPPGLGNIQISKLTVIFVDFILDEVMVNHSQNKPDLIKKVSEILCQWIFKYKIFSLNTIILLLLDRDDNSYSYQILDLMLFNSNEIKERIQFFEQQHFKDNLSYKTDDNYFLKNIEFNTTFNDLIPTIIDTSTYSDIAFQGALPIYYSNTISRFIPIIDIMMGKCIELDNKELLEKLINQFQIPYRYYHDEKETTIKDLLIYYFDSKLFQSSPETKLLFLKLLNFDNENKFTNYFNQYLKTNKIDEFLNNSSDYFKRELISPLAEMMDLSNPNVFNQFSLKLEHLFLQEFSNPVESKLNSILFELLLLPINQNEIVMGLTSCLDYSNINIQQSPNTTSFPNRNEPPSSSCVLSLSMIFSILPNSFHNILIPKITQDFSNEINLLKLNSPIMKNQYLYGNYSTNVQEKMTVPLEWYIYFLQFYFLYCPLERLLTLNEIVQNVKSTLKNVSQYFVLLSTVAPLLPRFGAQTKHLMSIVRDVLSPLNDPIISSDIESKLLQLDSNWLTNENNIDIDFMNLDDYYCDDEDDEDDIFGDLNNNGNNNNNGDHHLNDDSMDGGVGGGGLFTQGNQSNNIFSNHDMMDDGDRFNVDENSSYLDKEQKKILLKNDLEIIDSITDWIYHLKSIVPFPAFRDELYKTVKEFKPIFRKNFKNL